jgi:Rad3-related DNA helicase
MSLAARVAGWWGADGRLAARWPHFEDREGQRALALDVARTFEDGGLLLAEAPTGIGKSLAYLLPAVLRAAAADQRVVVATCTRALQDQLFERDLPALLEALEVRLPCARLKGKQNYLCPRSLDLVEPRGAVERAALERLRVWAAGELEGDLDAHVPDDPETFRRLRPRVATDPHACTAATCRRGRECFWSRARRQAAGARVLIVNHALLALSGEAEGLLPDFDLLVVDEAHRLEGVLIGQLQRSVSRSRIEEALRLVGTGRRAGGGLLARARALALPLFDGERGERLDRVAEGARAAREAGERLFARLAEGEGGGGRSGAEGYASRTRYRSALELFGRDLQPLEDALESLGRLARDLRRLAEAAAEGGEGAQELAAEAEQVAAQLGGLGDDLDRVGDAREPEWVYWRSSGGRGVELAGAPVSAAAHARRLVLSRARAAVLTSATLASSGRFDFLAERLGLGEERELPYEARIYPSPFPLERQMQVWVHHGGPDESESVAAAVSALSARTGRNLLALFTAHERLRRAREKLRERLPAGRVLLAQEWDGPAGLLAERFRGERGAVLLGVQSLWEGVDFPGEALEVLVVAKLPFSVPDDPQVEARAERLRERGLDPFRADSLPEAVLRFRQGVGRLIRRGDDRGVLVVCDPRLESAGYRRAFLDELPLAPRTSRDPGRLAEEAARFLEAPTAVEESM